MLQFAPKRGKLYHPTGEIVTYMFSIGANCNNIENYTICIIVFFLYILGYTSSLLLDNNDINHNIQAYNLVDFVLRFTF